MPVTKTHPFDRAVQHANTWVKDLAEELGHPDDRWLAYRAMRAVLHALRDRLTLEEAVHLGAQLPMLVRGCYYECWVPGATPVRERKVEQFLGHIADEFVDMPGPDAARLARTVFAVLSRHVSPGEIDDVKANLPEQIRALWP